MSSRVRMALVVLPVIAGMLWSGAAPAAAQGRTPWGDPDLQGMWTNTTTTPMERPDDLAGQATLTEEERAVRDPEVQAEVSFDRPPTPGNVGGYNEFWVERGNLIRQTSLIVDPPDGRLPALTPGAERQRNEFLARWVAPPGSWEDMNLYDRCITRGLPGAMIPGFYNHNYLILQTPGYVVVQVEMIHDTRIIPLDTGERPRSGIPQWLGDSRGYWDGDTLVVETRNFAGKGEQRTNIGRFFLTFSGGEHARLVERFTRIGEDRLDYRFTVIDPTVDTRSWTASIPMQKSEDALFEYACHEGNYALGNILAGARADERAAAAAGQQSR